MVWIALGLLALSVTWVALNTAGGRWGMGHWRSPRRVGPTFQQHLAVWSIETKAVTATSAPATGIGDAVIAAAGVALQNSGFLVFSRWAVFSVFLSFLLPVWSLSFATEALGGDRESRNLVWLLSRPMGRPAIYLAKFAALLPWALAFNLGGFGLMCLVAGRPGWFAFQVYWPAVAGASVAFCALFHLMSAVFRKAAVVAIVYSFFLETILGNMPGYLKRVSIGFYTRCLMFESAEGYGVLPPEKPEIYMPVDAATAWATLAAATVILLGIGMAVFARSEYGDEN
jgi:hypothetical protein